MTYQPAPQTTPPPQTSAAQLEPIDESTQHPMRKAILWVARALTWLINAYILIVEVILLLGFLLLLGGANPSSSFVEWAYRNLERAMRPFRGIFAPVEIGTAGNDVPAIFDTSIVFAMIVYAIIAIAVSALISWLTSLLHKVDRETAFQEAQERHQRELQAMSDRATIIEAQNAATRAAAAAAAAQEAGRYTAPPATEPDL